LLETPWATVLGDQRLDIGYTFHPVAISTRKCDGRARDFDFFLNFSFEDVQVDQANLSDAASGSGI
jgi:hypothetical protein